MVKKVMLAILAPMLYAASAAALAGDAEAGKAKYSTCAACHGQAGVSTVPNAPNLAGRDAVYIAEALKAFRSGSRPATVMQGMAAGLSDEDIANLGAYIETFPKP